MWVVSIVPFLNTSLNGRKQREKKLHWLRCCSSSSSSRIKTGKHTRPTFWGGFRGNVNDKRNTAITNRKMVLTSLHSYHIRTMLTSITHTHTDYFGFWSSISRFAHIKIFIHVRIQNPVSVSVSVSILTCHNVKCSYCIVCIFKCFLQCCVVLLVEMHFLSHRNTNSLNFIICRKKLSYLTWNSISYHVRNNNREFKMNSILVYKKRRLRCESQ